jgi:putative peptidoglycan lipid II flippase
MRPDEAVPGGGDEGARADARSPAGGENRRIARAAGLVSALTLLSRVSGLLRDIVISSQFGAGPAAEGFFVAFRLPNLFRRLAAEGAMSVAFIPVFAHYLHRESPAAAERALRALLSLVAIVLSAIVALGIVFAPQWVGLIAPGFAADPELMRLTVELTRLLFPYALLVGLVALCAGYLNSIRHFLAPALSPTILNLSIIAAALLSVGNLERPVIGLAGGVLAGGVLQLALQGAALTAQGVVPRPRWEPAHPAGGRVLSLLAPTVVGTAVFQINVLLSTVLASLLPAGSVSYLWYADRIFEFPLGMFAVALGTAALPSLASQASRGAIDELRRSLGFALALVNYLALPAACGLIVLAEPITLVLFERGAFGAREVAMTARALQYYALGLWSVSLSRLLAPGFYALGESRVPTVVAIGSVAVSLLLSVALMGPVAASGDAGWAGPIASLTGWLTIADLRHGGLALATSLAATFNAALLAVLLGRRVGGFAANVWGPLRRSAVATAVMTALLALVVEQIPWRSGGTATRALRLAAVIGLGGAVFAAAAWMIGGAEVARLRAWMGARRRRDAR